MSKLPEFRLLFETEPQSGVWNMAADEVLLDLAATQEVATFRWYRWAEPTLSLGYFQDVADVEADPRWAPLPKVRRLTGGGAILHHHEWTYSIAVPARQPLVARPEDLYDVVHLAVVECLQTCGYAAALRGETRKQSPEPLLCFSRSDSHDVILSGHKILGSAQRRRKGAILQHGSLLLRRSVWTPDHPGIEDLVPGGRWEMTELIKVPERLAEQVSATAWNAEEERAVLQKIGENSTKLPAHGPPKNARRSNSSSSG
jgi:lipoyl(octanoyl) transferase